MATLALGIVGGIVGSAVAPGAGTFSGAQIGFFIGGALGSIIDSTILFPAIFKNKPIQGPRVDDIGVTTASEGSPIFWILGPRNRVGGTCIWKSPLIEVKTTTKIGKGGGGQKVDNYTYFLDLAVGVCDRRGLPKINKLRKVFADTKVIYDGKDTPAYESLAFYDGSQAAPDPLMVSYKGAGNVPNYKNLCFYVLKRLGLADYGNRPPNLTAIVEQENNLSVAKAIGYILERAGLSPSSWDGTRLPFCLKGYITSGVQTSAEVLAPLLLAYAVSIQEVNGVVVGYPKGSEPIVDVAAADLGAHAEGEVPPRKIQFKDVDDYQVPSRLTVQFVDVDRDLEAGSESYTRWDHPSRSESVLSLPITFAGTEALAMAKRVLWSAEAERQNISVRLPPSYSYLREGQAVRVVLDDTTHIIWCKQVTRGANGILEVSGTRLQSDTYSQTATLDEVTGSSASPYRPPKDIYQVFADLPALVNDHLDKVGVYFAACAKLATDAWQGGEAFASGNDADYASIGTDAGEAVIGDVIQSPDAGPTDYFDAGNTMVVRVYNGGLGNATDAEMIAGANNIAVQTRTGWEVMAFGSAVLIGADTYLLSRFIRGLRNTERYVGDHIPGGKFVVGDLNTINFGQVNIGRLGLSDYYKFVPSQGLVTAYPSERVQLVGNTQKPFSPCQLNGQWTGQGSGGSPYTFSGASWNAITRTLNCPNAFRLASAGDTVAMSGSGVSGGTATILSVAGDGNSCVLTSDAQVATSDLGEVVDGASITTTPNNFNLRWRRRSKYIVAPFATGGAPLAPDESPERYEVEFLYGPGSTGVVLRTVAVKEATGYVYTAADQYADGVARGVSVTAGQTPIHAKVYQISNAVGRGTPGERVFFPP